VATPNTSRPGRALAVFALILVALVGGMFLRGTTEPKLGLDLQGGTSVTLVPRGDAAVTDDNLTQAVNIIRQRVNAFGVSESEVTTQGGRNIVVSVPGAGQRDLVELVGQTAQLRFRQVLQEGGPLPLDAQQPPDPAATPGASPEPTKTAKPGRTAKPDRTPKGTASPDATGEGRVLTRALQAQAVPSPTGEPSPSEPGTPPATAPVQPPVPPVEQDPAAQIPEEAQQRFADLDCTKPENRQGGEDVAADQVLVACDREGSSKYVLAPAEVLGGDVTGARAELSQSTGGLGGWQVSLNFNGEGTRQFADLTRTVWQLPPPQSQVAVVLDGLVVSAPVIQEPITGGQAQITGNFTQEESQDLANVLQYGALPVAFDLGEVNTVSPSLGGEQLRAGLLAGGLGLLLVVVYSVLYYRALGLVVVASLVVAAALAWATVSLLGGPPIGFRLTLAGVAGLIVAIGITADSFVVFFERLRDELRDGRTLRAAVEHGWTRARRTIIAADFVSLLAAGVLYILSVGSVRGFAFTLGLITLIDVLVVFLFTKPLVALLARTRFFGQGHRLSGLDPERLAARRRAPSEVIGRRRSTPREA
jgi:preprotein translocase subunit SecD